MADLIENKERMFSVREKLNATLQPYASRAEAMATKVPAPVVRIAVAADFGTLFYVADPSGTALPTGDGRMWSPDANDTIRVEHWENPANGDWTNSLRLALNWTGQNGYCLDLLPREYRFTRIEINLQRKGFLRLNGAVLFSTAGEPLSPGYESDYALRWRTSYRGATNVIGDVKAGQTRVQVASTANIQVGDTFQLRTTTLINTDHRGNSRNGQIGVVKAIDGDFVIMADPANMDYDNFRFEGSVQEVQGTNAVRLPASLNRPQDSMRIRMEMTSGALAGKAKYITGWDNTTKVANFSASSQDPWEAGMRAGDTFVLDCNVQIDPSAPGSIEIIGPGSLVRDPQKVEAGGPLGHRGLVLNVLKNPVVKDLFISGFSEAGLVPRLSYKPSFENVTVWGANRQFVSQGNASDGTGYGISLVGNYRARVVDCTSYECRRGFDTGGTNVSDWFAEFHNCGTIGGGTTYDGGDFFPLGDRYNGGMGSHGGGFFSKFINCWSQDVRNPMDVRGRRNEFLGYTHTGYCWQPALVFWAEGAVFRDIIIDSGGSWLKYRDGSHPITAADESKFPKVFADIVCDNINPNGALEFYNISINPLLGPFLNMTRNGVVPPIIIGDVTMRVAAPTNAARRFMLLNTTETNMRLGDVIITSPPVVLDADSADRANAQSEVIMQILPSSFIMTKPIRKAYDNSFLVEIPDKGVVKLPVYNARDRMVIDVVPVHNSNIMGVGMVLAAGLSDDVSPAKAVNKSASVRIANVPLTGTTGAAGCLTLSYAPNGGDRSLYIESQLGVPGRYYVTMRQFNLM